MFSQTSSSSASRDENSSSTPPYKHFPSPITSEENSENSSDSITPDSIVIVITADQRELVAVEDSSQIGCTLRSLQPLLFALPISVALKEVGGAVTDFESAQLTVIVIASTITFFSSIGLTGEAFKENFDNACYILRNRQRPPDWPALSLQKEIAAIALSLVPTCYGVVSNAAQTYIFITLLPTQYSFLNHKTLPHHFWEGLAATLATSTGLNTLLTESMEMVAVIRNRVLAGQRTPYANTASRYLSPLIGGGFGLLEAMQHSLEGYMVIKSILNLHNKSLPFNLAATLSFINIFPRFCLSGLFSINSFDELFHFLARREKMTPPRIVAFIFAVGLASYLSYLNFPLNKDFYKEVFADFGFDPLAIDERIYDGIASVLFATSLIEVTETFIPVYRVANDALQSVKHFSAYLYQSCCDVFWPPDETITQPFLPDLPQNTSELAINTAARDQDELPTTSSPYYTSSNQNWLTFHSSSRSNSRSSSPASESTLHRNTPTEFAHGLR